MEQLLGARGRGWGGTVESGENSRDKGPPPGGADIRMGEPDKRQDKGVNILGLSQGGQHNGER